MYYFNLTMFTKAVLSQGSNRAVPL